MATPVAIQRAPVERQLNRGQDISTMEMKMSSDKSTEQKIGDVIHPEIPAPVWATNRYVDDDGREVIDEHAVEHGRYYIELSRMVTLRATDSGDVNAPLEANFHPENVWFRWQNRWADGSVDAEGFTVFPADIPTLIKALEAAQQAMEDQR
ncbi:MULTISPECIES: hypothetical protein [Microbacterium]|uniref:hypothetical protein n=1 Tax=Microbacterium TaxID=33882 RepID=UPI0021A7F60F|nr:hypothetical protein [Microbacterium sp. p3-SID338]MCT1394583.1 hypothetical protein [Microbacterium sp. p3-SID338]